MTRQQSTAAQLLALVKQLQAERQEHQDAIAQIDSVLGGMGSAPTAKKRPGRPRKNATIAAAAPRGGRANERSAAIRAGRKVTRARRKFEVSGNDSILTFVKAAGTKGVKTSEIVKNWKSQGRSGDGYVQLSQLAKAGKIKKTPMKGEKGSRYTAA